MGSLNCNSEKKIDSSAQGASGGAESAEKEMSGEDAPQSTSTHDSMEERDRPEQGDLSGTDASVHVVPEKEIQSEEAQQGDGAPDADGSFKSANLNASAETEDENTTE